MQFCHPVLLTSHYVNQLPSLKVEGVSLLNNVRYEDDGIRVWKAYGIGSGKLITLQYPDLPHSFPLSQPPIHIPARFLQSNQDEPLNKYILIELAMIK